MTASVPMTDRSARADDAALSSPREAVHMPAAGPLDRLFSLVIWVVGLCWLVPMLTLLTVVHRVLPLEWVQLADRLYCRGQLALLMSSWRAVVHPAVDPEQPYVFMQNHINHCDHVTMYNGTPHIKQGLELREHFKYPVYGWFMKARGTIAVDRGRAGQSAEVMANMREEIRKGRSILTFPEGTRTTTGRVGKLRRGTFFIARDLGVPIVPVAITGMYEVMRKGSYLLRPFQRVTVHYLEPIATAGLEDDEIPALADEVERRLSEVVDAYWVERGYLTPEGEPVVREEAA